MKSSFSDILRFASLIATFLTSPHAYADVCTDNSSGNVWACWVDEVQVMCGDCNRNSSLFNRANCNSNVSYVPKARIYQTYLDIFAHEIERVETRVAEAYIRISAVSNKMLEYINDSGLPPVNPENLSRLDDLRVELATVEHTRVELQDQMVRIQQAVLTSPSSDLLKQLELLRTQIVEAEDKAKTIRDEMTSVYSAYISSNSGLIEPETYQGLRNQRSTAEADLRSAQDDAVRAARRSLAGAKVLKMLEDQNFMWEHLHHNYPATTQTLRDFGRVHDDLSHP